MGGLTLADAIRKICRRHLEENDGLLMGQSITAVGWVNQTVPDCRNIVELPMTDIAGAGFAVGAALVGRRPILVIRFQDFLILNASPLINYAAKTKDLHGRSAPVFVRAVGAEGVGPVHSGALHGIFMHFPGFRVCAPVTPGEYQAIWDDFMAHDDPMIVSEHRDTFQNAEEFADIVDPEAAAALFPISAARLEAVKAAANLAAEGIRCSIVHQLWLKPLAVTAVMRRALLASGRGLVIDVGHETAGASQAIAYALTQETGIPVRALGLADRTKCLCPPLQNRYPDAARIADAVRSMVRG